MTDDNKTVPESNDDESALKEKIIFECEGLAGDVLVVKRSPYFPMFAGARLDVEESVPGSTFIRSIWVGNIPQTSGSDDLPSPAFRKITEEEIAAGVPASLHDFQLDPCRAGESIAITVRFDKAGKWRGVLLGKCALGPPESWREPRHEKVNIECWGAAHQSVSVVVTPGFRAFRGFRLDVDEASKGKVITILIAGKQQFAKNLVMPSTMPSGVPQTTILDVCHKGESIEFKVWFEEAGTFRAELWGLAF